MCSPTPPGIPSAFSSVPGSQPGLDRFTAAVRRELSRWSGIRPRLRIIWAVFAALAGPAGVTAHRPGALERAQLALGDWRAVRCLAAERSVRQFLDIGTGLPTAGNTDEVAQAVAPAARVVYADNDPVVLSHAQALLTSTPEGATDYLEVDLRHVPAIVAARLPALTGVGGTVWQAPASLTPLKRRRTSMSGTSSRVPRCWPALRTWSCSSPGPPWATAWWKARWRRAK